MKIQVEKSGDRTALVRVADRLDASNSHPFRQSMDAVCDSGYCNILVDLTSTQRVDSVGMGALVHLLKRCREMGGDAKLTWPSQAAVRRILWLTRFDRIFEFVGLPGGLEQDPWRL